MKEILKESFKEVYLKAQDMMFLAVVVANIATAMDRHHLLKHQI
jgi:hypothetical protein